MTRLSLNPLAGMALSGLLMTGILGSMVQDRVSLLKTGREIELPIIPVDPRDLFKGDFTRMAYGEVSRLDKALLPKLDDNRTRQQVYVTLEQGAADAWRPVAVTTSAPKDLKPNQVALAGKTGPRDGGLVRYGLERYYVPEGTGGRIEDMARKGKLSAIVAVDGKGRAAIKGLVFEGRRIHNEPPL